MRLLLMHFRLRERGHHPYSETLGWIRWAKAHGVQLQIIAARIAQPDMLAETGAAPAWGLDDDELARRGLPLSGQNDAQTWRLNDFMRESAAAAAACRTAWAAADAPPDVMIFPWVMNGDLNGIADFLAELAPGDRPPIGLNFIRAEPTWRANPERTGVDGDISWLRFGARRLKALLPPDKLAITAVEPRLARTLALVCEHPAHAAPPQVTYPADEELQDWRPASPADRPLVGLMGQTRDEKAFARAGELMARIATVRPQARFFMQAGDAALAQRVAAAARAGGASAEIVIGGLAHEAYWRRLLANDLMLLPYDGHAYALMPSGPFCEAAAAGVPVVAPRHTWMGDRLAEGSAAGVTFDAATPDQIVAATARALDALPALKAQAAILAPAWRAERSLDNHIEAILELLGLRPAR